MWRSLMFWRLFGAYSLLLAASLGLLGWILHSRVENHLLAEIRQGLESKTVLVQELIAGPDMDAHQRQQQIVRLAQETDCRITLLAADGTVLADSAEDPRLMDNHLNRPEVRQAEATGVGAATRYSETMRQPMMYVARRVAAGPVRYVRLALPLGAVAEETRWLRQAVWTGTGVSLVLALLVSMVLARRMSAPLVELASAARSMAEGYCGQEVKVASADEIGTLALVFNEMSRACAAHIAQMERDRQQLRAIFGSMVEGVLVLDAEGRVQFLNEAAGRLLNLPAGAEGRNLSQLVQHRSLAEAVAHITASEEPYEGELEWDTTPRKVLAVHGNRLPGEPLRGLVLVLHDITHLRRLEQVRQDFVANVSHELKTPLAAIQATVETLLDGALHDPEHGVRFLERVRENTDRLHRLVQDLLTLSRVESGEAVLERRPVPLHAAVEASLSRHEHRAASKGLRLEQAPPAEPVTALTDEEALAEILDNLLDNAIKYTPPGGRITLRWFAEGGAAVFQVEDTGIGIPEKDLPRIFERFYRVDRARSRELGGTGLGLSIVKHLAQALGGSVTASSQVGVGSVFTVRLPEAAVPRAEKLIGPA